jgi:ATP phosphoribosyltransferase regulatory subunit
LLDALLAEESASVDTAQVLHAVRHKEVAALPASLACAPALRALLEASGAPQQVRDAAAALTLPPRARALLDALFAVADALPAAQMGAVRFTLDPLEGSGFTYHQGVCFSLFHTESRQEIGRGGRYGITLGGTDVSATGATLYVDRLLECCAPPPPPVRVFVPFGVEFSATHALREEGMITIHAPAPVEDHHAEAQRLGCTHLYQHGAIIKHDKT